MLFWVAVAYLSTGYSTAFIRDMSAGKGYQGGAWSTLARCVLFGFLEAVAIRLKSVAVPGIGGISVQIVPGAALYSDSGAAGWLYRPGPHALERSEV
jgi:ABC-type uncharacterized transport system permease subunit